MNPIFKKMAETQRDELEKYFKRPFELAFKNGSREVAYIVDPIYQAYQRATYDRAKGSHYTNGFELIFIESRIWFWGILLEHSVTSITTLTLNMKTNPDLQDQFFSILKKLNNSFHLSWSSKTRSKQTNKKKHVVGRTFESFKDFESYLKNDLKISLEEFWKDVGVSLPNTYHGKNFATMEGRRSRGTHFCLSIDPINYPKYSSLKLVKLFGPIFQAMYPSSREKSRRDKLRSKLLTYYKNENLTIECAHRGCKTKAKRKLQAAHLKAYHAGGSDSPKNGVFLCKTHHQKQEGLPFTQQQKFIKQYYKRHTALRKG